MTPPPILRSALLAAVPGVAHAFFTRRGGVSTGIYESLNLGRGSRDATGAVAQNRRRAAGVFGLPPGALNVCWQTHSARILVADRPWAGERPRGDGVITVRAGVLCGVLSADCAPVLIADGEARIVAALHAGWRGALDGVVAAAVEAMKGLGARPSRMVAAIGPCIGPASYEVGPDFLDRFEAEAPGSERFFTPGDATDKRRFDLPGYVLSRLEAEGVERAEWIGRDTCAEQDDFFSNRRAVQRGEKDYGRLLSAIMLDA
ncbi:MAG: peptidoglycan editing factor PgeF [Caulobacteraceae bacterium]|nr:peptidoglycan editing factor PgeF [Caulobacteraceae bacterium]